MCWNPYQLHVRPREYQGLQNRWVMLSVLISLGHHQAARDFVEKWKPNLQTHWDADYSQVFQYGYDASY